MTEPKKYLNLDGLEYFISKLQSIFSIIGHTHSIDSINSGDGVSGQILTKTSDGMEWRDSPTEIPITTTSDDGKFLRVVNGSAAWQAIENAEGVRF